MAKREVEIVQGSTKATPDDATSLKLKSGLAGTGAGAAATARAGAVFSVTTTGS